MSKEMELLTDVKSILAAEGIHSGAESELTSVDKLSRLIFPALENSKNIQASLYSYQPTPGKSFMRKLKNSILSKIRNVTIAILERTIMRQQKVNELTFLALKELAAENTKLHQELASLRK